MTVNAFYTNDIFAFKSQSLNIMKILFVCLGNICRSPLAQGILERKTKNLGWEIDSAGTNKYHTGDPPHTLSQKVAQKRGIDISGQRARNFLASDLAHYDLIYVMAEDVLEDVKRICGDSLTHKNIKYFLEELPGKQNLNVPDPWYGEEDGYEEVYALIDKTCEAIVKKYSK